MKMNRKKPIFSSIQIGPGSTGPSGPARNSTDASADSVIALMNSAFANIAKRMPPYSVW